MIRPGAWRRDGRSRRPWSGSRPARHPMPLACRTWESRSRFPSCRKSSSWAARPSEREEPRWIEFRSIIMGLLELLLFLGAALVVASPIALLVLQLSILGRQRETI